MQEALGHRIGYLMKRVQHALRTRMDEALRQMGLTTPQYAALSALAEEPGLSGAALARTCFVTPQTMNEILGGLVRAGLVTRMPHPEHGRIVQTQLTDRGKDALAAAQRLISTIEKRIEASLIQEERIQMAEMLQRLADILEQ